MNTIPLTFNERQLHRTVLSGNESVPVVKLPLGVLLLNTGSGGLYRVKLLENLIKNGFSSIVSVEKSSENGHFDLDLPHTLSSAAFFLQT